MSHHSDKPMSDELLALLNTDLKIQAKALHLGNVKNSHIDGKLTKDDKGDFEFALNTVAGRVLINFGAPVTWCAFTPKQARELALLLRTEAAKARKEGE